MQRPSPGRACVRALLAILIGCLPGSLYAQSAATADERERSGEALYLASCAACHAADGKGAPRRAVGFDLPIPDFTDCSFATPEPDADWVAVTHQGGPTRAFDRRMPAFGMALSNAEITRIIRYVRGFCTDRAWPAGELNLPRPLVTEKAFPENEAVYTSTIQAGGSGAIGNEFLYEQRLGSRTQFEVVVPVDAQEATTGGWSRGLGDLAVAVKRVLFHSLERGRIFSAVAEVVLPTGNEKRGLGKGTAVFEPFVAFGQILPSDSFVQVQAGFELPADRALASNEMFVRTALGRTYAQDRGFGRAWTPMVELLAARELKRGETTHWDVVPQLQVSLSRRQHILLNAGVRIPVNDREGRHPSVITYLLWDWFDGGFLEGWR